MKTRTLWFGRKQSRSPALNRLATPTWPDTDRRWRRIAGGVDLAYAEPGIYRETPQPCEGAEAFALAPDGDVDALKLYFDGAGGDDYHVLTPGALIRHRARTVQVAPLEPFPATRLFNVGRRLETRIELSIPDGQVWQFWGHSSPGTDYRFRLISGGPALVYFWDGSTWIVDDTIDTGDDATPTLATEGADNRICDYSPNGRDNFVDLFLAGLIAQHDEGAV